MIRTPYRRGVVEKKIMHILHDCGSSGLSLCISSRLSFFRTEFMHFFKTVFLQGCVYAYKNGSGDMVIPKFR